MHLKRTRRGPVEKGRGTRVMATIMVAAVATAGALTGCAPGGGSSYRVGDTGPAGGVVYYVSSEAFPCGENLENLCNHLEAAPVEADAERAWADEPYVSTEVEGADATAIGTGWRNTVETVRQGNDDPATSAAAYADAYVFGGKDDWYLPSKDEVYELYEQMLASGTSSGVDYWTSNEQGRNTAWSQNTWSGPQFRRMKFDVIHVRPIRAF